MNYSGTVWRIGLSFLVLLAVLLVAPLIGSSSVDWGRAWNGLSPDAEILWNVRLPRVLLAAIAGGTLSIAGLLFQALLRDALATPYTLGISSGSSLGAVCAISFELGVVWPFALIGALASLWLVLGIAVDGRRISSFTLLLAGVTVNSMALALILFLQSFTTFGKSIAIAKWLMGSIEVTDGPELVILAAVVIPAIAVLLWRARDWNLLAVGEEWAAARGVPVQQRLLLGYFIGSLLTAAVTSLTGPIGFVGLIVPHALRLRFGADHRVLLPCCLALGAAFLVICDVVARVAIAPAEAPAGVVTALCGGPFFIWLLKKRRITI